MFSVARSVLRHQPVPVRAFASTARSFEASGEAPLRKAMTESAEKESLHVHRIDRLMAMHEALRHKAPAADFLPTRMRGLGIPHQHKDVQVQPLPTERRMQDSYVQMDLVFSKDESLRNQYVGAQSSVRMGRLMEDFDTIAGTAAYRYVLPDGVDPADTSKYGLYLVTASVDRIDMLRPLADPRTGAVPDLRLSAHVAYASTSSMEIFVRLSSLDNNDTILLGRFTMACRSVKGGKQIIPKLIIEEAGEKELYDMGKEMREGKQKRREFSLEKLPPTEEEALRMHSLFELTEEPERNAPTPSDVIWMTDTKLNSALMVHPQEANLHQKIFGGYIMRMAYETAYSTACLFALAPVRFIALDELHFRQPVEIGSLLHLDSRVTFSPLRGEHKSFHVQVEASTTNLRTGERLLTNTFHYTFASSEPLKKHVLPRSYLQAMAWLDAQRRRELGISIRRDYDALL